MKNLIWIIIGIVLLATIWFLWQQKKLGYFAKWGTVGDNCKTPNGEFGYYKNGICVEGNIPNQSKCDPDRPGWNVDGLPDINCGFGG